MHAGIQGESVNTFVDLHSHKDINGPEMQEAISQQLLPRANHLYMTHIYDKGFVKDAAARARVFNMLMRLPLHDPPHCDIWSIYI